MANGFVTGVIALVIGVIMVVNVLLPTLNNANTSSFSTAESALFNTISIGAFVGLVVSAFAIFGLA